MTSSCVSTFVCTYFCLSKSVCRHVLYVLMCPGLSVMQCKMLHEFLFACMLGVACQSDITAVCLPGDISLYTSKYPVFTETITVLMSWGEVPCTDSAGMKTNDLLQNLMILHTDCAVSLWDYDRYCISVSYYIVLVYTVIYCILQLVYRKSSSNLNFINLLSDDIYSKPA